MENNTYTYQQRIDALRATKLKHTQEKWDYIGVLDYDDYALILPPVEYREKKHLVSASGLEITDVLYTKFVPKTNHPGGGFFGARICGENFGKMLEIHPVYIDPFSSLAGSFMMILLSYRDPYWNPDFNFSHLENEHKKYKITLHGIGAAQHFCHDMTIGFELGWKGILDKIRHYRTLNTDEEATELYDGLEDIVSGFQNWIGRHAVAAREMAAAEKNRLLKQNLLEIAEINEKLVSEPPTTFREACQWMLWYQIAGKMYNAGGSLGRIDQFLLPFYERDITAGILTDEEAIFHIACHFIHDTSYIQLGGPDENGHDATNKLSYLVLEAAHRLKIPMNVGVCVGEKLDTQLLRRGVEILFEDKTGIPKFLGIDVTSKDFTKNGYPIELGRDRVYCGCNWHAIPGREYTMNDCVKLNLGVVFEVAFYDMMDDKNTHPSVAELWKRYEYHMSRAVDIIAQSMDFHLDHMFQVFPELHLDLLCHGPIERGRDASHGGVEFYNLGLDAAGLATVADSFAALEQRIEIEKRLTWQELTDYLKSDWAGTDGERARLMMKKAPKFGSGGSLADDYAIRVSRLFTNYVIEHPTPKGFKILPGIFSWALTVQLGKDVGATPNGRHAYASITHGPNPEPGFRKDSAPSALAVAVAKVQPGYGNTAPMQIELDPGLSRDEENIEKLMSLIKTHFELGGTQINMNILDKQKIVEAHEDPSRHPDLVVRVTGFSAYFASLSPELRQVVVDRIVTSE
ncbi:formate acetyltransferase [candidate division KSB1 bacterium]|nr:formate acetyltransferase [candidate division KSB1 bacterium]